MALFFLIVFSAYGQGNLDEKPEPPRITSKKIGDYRVTITEFFETYETELVITKGTTQVFKERDFGVYYYFGNQFDDMNRDKDPYSGTDVTGNKVPDLVITKYTGGSMCCHFLYVFEIGKHFKQILTLKTRTSYIRLRDFDRDGISEIEFWDGAVEALFSSSGVSTPGRFVLKYGKGGYYPAISLMKQPPPTDQQFKGMKVQIQKAYDPVYPLRFYDELLSHMVDLSYNGHLDRALKLADEVWPLKKSGLEKFKSKFQASLNDSQHWRSFSTLL